MSGDQTGNLIEQKQTEFIGYLHNNITQPYFQLEDEFPMPHIFPIWPSPRIPEKSFKMTDFSIPHPCG